MSETVEIVEVGPRDGLQNEKRQIPTAQKIALVSALAEVGFTRIEVASFVSPKWVPQMADGAKVLAGIPRRDGLRYAALTPNMRGFQGALAAKADEIAIFGAASEGFSKANLNCTIEESFDRFAPICAAAAEAGLPVRGYVSCVTDCPFDGATPPEDVAHVASRMRDLGCYEISLGETLGRGEPVRVARMLEAVLTELPAAQLAGHFHDTGGRALDNIDVALDLGLRVFDASAGGLGGCPYAPGAAGNVATEAVADHLAALGYATGLDRAALALAAAMARGLR
ncbi:hydroxymethylglutaryl-CoA lyase [Dinoroseobacter sp. S76]|uniref:hydroxymethylglutaryl-CoA lyase n=1 Tax=Dinoroseobacter sp. S76 TaxID=3415124 RepID=UPI003C7BDE68